MNWRMYAEEEGRTICLGVTDCPNMYTATDEGRLRVIMRRLDVGKPIKFLGVGKERH